MPRPSPFLTAPPLRAMLETLLAGALLWFALLLFYKHFSPYTLQLVISFSIGPVSLFVYSLRLRLPAHFMSRQSILDAVLAIILCFALATMEWAFIFILQRSGTFLPFRIDGYRSIAWTALALVLSLSLFIICRGAVRMWLYWDKLRRKQLRWALTHAHIITIALGAALLILLLDALILIFSANFSLILPTTLGLTALGLVALVVVVPISALFSYIVTRRTTDRLKTLAAATSGLRSGHYTIRVPVVGEDEVAQLQADFNAMAASLERALRDLQGERDTVAGLLQARRELVAGVSHELRTPIATLRSYLETTLMHWDDNSRPALQHDLQVMENEVLHLQVLIEDLFALSRAEVGRLTLRCEPANVGELVQRIVDTRAPLVWQTNRIEVIAAMPPEVPPVSVDANRLSQALQNLLHNAVRHTSPGGIVAVAIMLEAETLILQVKDTGEGIAPEDLPRIWERFYQAQNTHIHLDTGAGLGLALVKEWVEAMGGTVAAESVPGEGSCFSMRFPLQPVTQYPSTVIIQQGLPRSM